MKINHIPSSKYISCILILSVCFCIEAYARNDFPVLVRDNHFRPKISMQQIESLMNATSFDGPSFKIVSGDSDVPISFNCDPETLLRASTVYYHLEKAQNYFINHIHSDYVKKLEKMTIRINVTRTYNSLGHYAHINSPPVYNNALSIMESPGYPSKGIGPWGKEIWFRPAKEMTIPNAGISSGSENPLTMQLKGLRESVYLSTLEKIIIDLSNETLVLSEINAMDGIEYLATGIGLEFSILVANPLTSVISRKKYWLDTAMVPEIIYHEYAHQALSDSLPTSHSGAVIEGMADFFAGKIANSAILAGKIKKYNSFTHKKAKQEKRKYSMIYESDDMAHDDFVFAFLWDLQKIVGTERSIELVYDSRDGLNSYSKIRSELTQSLLDSCSRICANPVIDRYMLLEYFNSWGI